MGEMVRTNISVKEAACPCCGELPNDRLLNRLQALREQCGFPLRFTSTYRCPTHNRAVGGSPSSVHMLGNRDDLGAADIGIRKHYSKKRFLIIAHALDLGFNNLEVCNEHLHVGVCPESHRQHKSLYWGISK